MHILHFELPHLLRLLLLHHLQARLHRLSERLLLMPFQLPNLQLYDCLHNMQRGLYPIRQSMRFMHKPLLAVQLAWHLQCLHQRLLFI